MKVKQNRNHLTLKERILIQEYLQEGCSIRYIADRLDRSPSTISREIKKHSKKHPPTYCDCLNFSGCDLKHVCGSNTCNKLCKKCRSARKHCGDYAKKYCDIISDEPTRICNSCSKKHICHFEKITYDADEAEMEYKNTLTNSRNGFDCSYEEIVAIDEIVSPLIKQGQSVYHITQSHKEDIPVSSSTLRRMIHNSELECRNIDMRNVVQRKPRMKRENKAELIRHLVAKDGHTYSDYLEYMKNEDISSIVQMDCVEGSKYSSSVLLTLHFASFHMQLAIILPSHTSTEVISALDKIESCLGKELFAVCFPVILTDNGHEFADIEGMERSIFGGTRTKIFFCEPRRSDEKGACENNHKLIRYVIPKGVSMDNYNQIQISTMMNHINSYCRQSLYGKCPYDLAMSVMPEDFFLLLGLEKVPADEVLLKPSLLGA